MNAIPPNMPSAQAGYRSEDPPPPKPSIYKIVKAEQTLIGQLAAEYLNHPNYEPTPAQIEELQNWAQLLPQMLANLPSTPAVPAAFTTAINKVVSDTNQFLTDYTNSASAALDDLSAIAGYIHDVPPWPWTS